MRGTTKQRKEKIRGRGKKNNYLPFWDRGKVWKRKPQPYSAKETHWKYPKRMKIQEQDLIHSSMILIRLKAKNLFYNYLLRIYYFNYSTFNELGNREDFQVLLKIFLSSVYIACIRTNENKFVQTYVKFSANEYFWSTTKFTT